MRIGIDARLVTYRRGIGNVVYNLLLALAELPYAHSFVLYVDDPQAVELAPANPRFTVKVLGPKVYPVWEQISLPIAAARDQLAVLHCPANTAPLILTKRVKLVLTIHDVMYLLPRSCLPKSHSLAQRVGRLYRRLIVPQVARRATAVVTDSHHSRRDIVKYLNLDENDVRVVCGAANGACRIMTDRVALTAVRAKYGLARPFILALGGLDPRKNTAGIIKAYAYFRQQAADRYQLVLVGLPAVGERRFRQLAQALGLDGEVVTAGFVPEEDLVALYNAAEVLVYPSLYEGFGLPVLEAMACGTPVISSPRGSIPEVAADAALLVSPTDIEGLGKAMIQVIRDGTLRKTLIARGFEQARKFSWEIAAREMLKVYEKCAGR